MRTIQAIHRTGSDGSLSLSIPLGQPHADFEVVVIVQPTVQQSATVAKPPADPWAGADAIRAALVATGQSFSDSTGLVREDRDR